MTLLRQNIVPGSPRMRTTMRLKPELVRDIQIAARREGRTASNLVEHILTAGLKTRRRGEKAAPASSVFE